MCLECRNLWCLDFEAQVRLRLIFFEAFLDFLVESLRCRTIQKLPGNGGYNKAMLATGTVPFSRDPTKLEV